MAKVIWSGQALGNLEIIQAYIRVYDSRAASRIGSRLIAAGNSLADFPRRGRSAAHGTRELPTVPPYVITYDVAGETITILRIRHGRQRTQ